MLQVNGTNQTHVSGHLRRSDTPAMVRSLKYFSIVHFILFNSPCRITLQTTSCKTINGLHRNNQPIQDFLASHGLDLLTRDLNKEGFNTTNDLRELKAAAIASSGSPNPIQIQHTSLHVLIKSTHFFVVHFSTPFHCSI